MTTAPTGPNNRSNPYYAKPNHVELARTDYNRSEFFGTIGGVGGAFVVNVVNLTDNPTYGPTAQIGVSLTYTTDPAQVVTGQRWLVSNQEAATTASYTPVAGDDLGSLRVEVSTDTEAVRSQAYRVRYVPANNTVAPTTTAPTGVNLGDVLSGTDGEWADDVGGVYTYQWQRNGSNIGGATSSTYTIVSADSGAELRRNVTYTNSGGAVTAVSSNAVTVQTFAAPTIVDAPVITSDAIVDDTSFTATPGNWDGNPMPVVTERIWRRGNTIVQQGSLSLTYAPVGLGSVGEYTMEEIVNNDIDTASVKTLPRNADLRTQATAGNNLGPFDWTVDITTVDEDFAADFTAEGNTLSYAFTGLPPGVVNDGDGSISGTPTAESSGNIVCTATDEYFRTTTSTATQTTTYRTQATLALLDQSFNNNSGNQLYDFTNEITANGNTPQNYRIDPAVTGITIPNSAVPIIQFDTNVLSISAGTAFTVKFDDEYNRTTSDAASVEIIDTSYVVTITGLSTDSLGSYAQVGTHATIGFTTDPAGGTITQKWGTTPGGEELGTGTSPTEFLSDGILYLEVTRNGEVVSDATPIRYAPGNAPTIANQAAWIVDDQAVNIDGSASGANLTFTYTLSSKPQEIVTDPNTGQITGTVTFAVVGAAGSGTAQQTAVDQYGRTYSDTFNWSYQLRAQATAANNLGPYSFDENIAITPQDLSLDFTANDNTLTYANAGITLPAGLQITALGVLQGTPTEPAADATYTVRGTDEYSRTTDSAFDMEITQVLTAPVITGVPTIDNTTPIVGDALTATPASVTGSPTPTRAWQWFRDATPVGTDSPTYTTVLADEGALITVRQTETNSEGSDSAISDATSAVVHIAPVAGGALQDQSFTNNTGSQTYDVSFDFTGEDLAYSVQTGPAGVTVNSSSGVVTFDTNALDVQSGTSIVIRATNSGGFADSGFSLTITAVATAPAAFTAGQWTVATGSGSTELDINITDLPNDGGSAITALQYQLDTLAWQNLTGTGTGLRTITAPAANTAYDVKVRAVNAIGAGADSDTKTETSGDEGGFGNFTFTTAQSATYPPGTTPQNSPALTLGSPITAGNLLIVIGAERSGNVPGDHAVTDNNGKTWNRIPSLDFDNSVPGEESETRMSQSVWWREVDSTGETNPAPTIFFTAPSPGMLQVMEIEPSASYNWTVSTTSITGSGEGTLDNLNSGDAAPSGNDILVIGLWSARNGSELNNGVTMDEYTNTVPTIGDRNSISLCIGYLTTSQTDSSTYSSTADIGGNQNSEGAIATLCFRDAP